MGMLRSQRESHDENEEDDINLSLDSRMYSVNCSKQIEIFKADFTIGTIKFENDNFYKLNGSRTLSAKVMFSCNDYFHYIENNIGDLEPSFPIIDDQTVANGGFGIASFGITPFAKEEDRVA